MKKFLFLMTASVALLATACQQKQDPVTPAVTLTSEAEVGVPTEGGQFTVTFTSNVPWTVSLDNANWTVSPKSGDAGSASVKVTATDNTTNDPVVSKLTIKAQSASATVVFTQLQKDGMVVNVTEYEAPCEASTVRVTVLANVTVTATANDDWLTIAEGTKGLVEKTFEVAVAANEGEAREGTVTIKGAGKEETVTIKQAAFEPKFEVDNYDFDVTKDGGEFTVNITTNVEFTVKDYSDGSFPWQSATLAPDKKSLKVVIGANENYDARTSYVKFTVPAIQDPVIDESTGEPTGETKDHEERVYFHQVGYTTVNWETALPEQFKTGTQLSMAKLSDFYLLYDGVNFPVFFNPSTGEITGIDDWQIIVESTKAGEDIEIAEIFNDDAGNLLAVTKASYLEQFDVFVIPAGISLESVEPVILFSSYFDYYGYGYGHFAASGNVLDDGVVTAFFTGQVDYGTSAAGVYWEIENGQVGQRELIEIPTGSTIWASNNVAFVPFGTSAADGFLYDGYDGTYTLRHIAGGVSTPLATIGDWANGVTSIKVGVWGSKPVVAINNMSYFPQWSYASVLTVFDATAMTPITTVEILADGREGSFMSDPHQSSCLLFEQKGDALIVYSADGSQGLLQKITIPAK